MSEFKIPVYHISTYTEPREIINIPIDEFLVELTDDNPEKSYYEILNENTKLYFDIEGISFNEPDLIDQIIKDLIEFIHNESDIEINKYVLTINKASKTHKGLSYHLIFPEYYVLKNQYLKQILNKFIKLHYEYVNFMDASVYSRNRLFKCVNQYGFEGNSKVGYVIDVEPIVLNGESYFNKHTLINGTLEESVINYIQNSKVFPFDEKKYPPLRFNNYVRISETDEIPNVIRNRKEVGDELFAIIYTISLVKTNDDVSAFMKDLIEHYKSHNNTFVDYAIPLETLKIIIYNIKSVFNINC